MLQISAFTKGTFVSSLDVQTAIFESEARGSSLWLDVYRPKDNEVMLFNRYVHEVPQTDNSFVFPLGGFKTLKRLIICRGDARQGAPALIADATILFANDLIITVRSRGFQFNELLDFVMRANAGRMPEDPYGLYSLLPQTLFGMFSNDLDKSAQVNIISEKSSLLSEDVAFLGHMNWTLREMTMPMDSLLRSRDSDSLTMSILAVPNAGDRLSSFASSSIMMKSEEIAKFAQPRTSIAAKIPAADQTAAVPQTSSTKKLTPYLKITKGPDTGKVFAIVKSPLRIGRDPSNDIVLVANGISRRHAIVTIEGSKVLLTDLGSTNGTYVNTKRIQQAALKAGDEVFIGSAILSFDHQ
jgi:hypothetical protein